MSNTDRARILIIEDNPDLLDILAELLGERYDVTGAVRGEDGIRVARSVHPDLVILDLQLPGMDGIEAGLAMKREQPDLPILVLSASAGKEPEMVLESGCCDAFMAKPTPLDVIEARVEELLRTRRTDRP